jgi:hypothetical protein
MTSRTQATFSVVSVGSTQLPSTLNMNGALRSPNAVAVAATLLIAVIRPALATPAIAIQATTRRVTQVTISL